MSISSTGSSGLNLQGLSGYDFSGIVDSMVQAYKIPETKMAQQQSDLQVQKDAWRDVKTRLSALENTLNALKDKPTWTATQATSSNPDALKATGGSGAVQGTYSIDIVQLAQAQTVTSAAQNVTDQTTALDAFAGGGGTFKIAIGGDLTNAKSITVNKGASLADVANAINNAQAGVSATVLNTSSGYLLSLTDSQTGVKNAASFVYDSGVNVLSSLGITQNSETAGTLESAGWTTSASNTISFTIGTTTQNLTINSGSSLQNIADQINGAGVNVSARVITDGSGNQQLALSHSTTDTSESIVLKDDATGNLLSQLGLNNSTITTGFINKTKDAVDANITVNGITNVQSATNTVTDAIPGLTLNLQAQTTSSVTVTVSADYSKAEGAISAFVSQYNSTMDFIATKMSYNKDTQAKGDLFGDPTLIGIQERLRDMVTGGANNPTGPYTSLGLIGIGTSSTDYTADNNYGQSGQISFDKSKFESAMKDNPGSVANLFSASFNGVDPSDSQGLANVLDGYLQPLVQYNGSLDQTQNNLGSQIDDIKKSITDFEERANQYQENLKLKFSTLESTLAGLNSQGNWLTSQINAMSGQTKK